MIKFKIGDKVKSLRDYIASPNSLIKDKIYTVAIIENCSGPNTQWIGLIGNYEKYPNWRNDWFELVEREVIKNDIEWLDRVQQNFKE